MHFVKRTLWLFGAAFLLSSTVHAESSTALSEESISIETQTSSGEHTVEPDTVNNLDADQATEPEEALHSPLAPDAETTNTQDETTIALSLSSAVVGRWINPGGIFYYLNSDNRYHTGWLAYNNYWYYLQANGAMQTGWADIPNDGTYFFKPTGEMVTGTYTVAGKDYLFDAYGRKQTGWHEAANSTTYYYDPQDNGVKAVGWRYIAENEGWFYFDKDGKLATGWQTIDNARFYLDNTGKMLTGWQKINHVYYLFDEFGRMKTGWYYDKAAQGWYYLKENGQMATKWHQPANDTRFFYFDEYGRMLKGWQTVSGKFYYLDEFGAMKTGWHYDNNYGKWYYLNPAGDAAIGWQFIDNAWYYFNAGGDMHRGWVRQYGTTYYYLDQFGRMVTGVQQIDGKTYSFDRSGALLNGLVRNGNTHTLYDANSQVILSWDITDMVSASSKKDIVYIYNSDLRSIKTYVVSGTIMFVDRSKPVRNGYYAVLVAGNAGYAREDELERYNGVAPHFVSEDGALYHRNTNTQSSHAIFYGNAPEQMKAGERYYSFDGIHFDRFTFSQPHVYESLRSKTYYTAEQINAIYKRVRPDSLLVNAGQAFKDAEEKYNINALYLIAHSALESAWGTSQIARAKNNFFGIAAYDSNPFDSATQYQGVRNGVLDGAKFINDRYLTSSSVVYNGDYVGDKNSGMNVKYASDPYWGRKIAQIWSSFETRLRNMFGY